MEFIDFKKANDSDDSSEEEAKTISGDEKK